MNRRELIFGSAAAMAGFLLPKSKPTDQECTLWVVFLGANMSSCNPGAYPEMRKTQNRILKAGYEVLDTLVSADSCPKILARRSGSRRWAEGLHRNLMVEEETQLDHIAHVKSLWIEVHKSCS